MVKQEANWKQAPLPEPQPQPQQPIVSKNGLNSVLEKVPPPDGMSHLSGHPLRVSSWMDTKVRPPWYIKQALRELEG